MKEKLNRILSISATIVTMIFGIMVIVGWLIHNDFLRSIVSGGVEMKFNAALNFIFSSIVLLLYHFRKKSKALHIISVSLCVFISLTGLLTLTEYIFGMNLGIDEFFVRDEHRTTTTYYAGRMSPISAINSFQIGIGLLFLNKKRTFTIQFIYLFEITFVALLMLISFNFVTDIPTYFHLAIHVAIGYIMLALAIYFAQPELQKKISFEYIMLTGSIAIMLLMLVISIYSFYYNNELINSSRLVEHTHGVIFEAEQTLSLAKDIVSEPRAYAILNDSIYLAHFAMAEKSIFNHIKAIKELTKNNLSQQTRIDSLSEMISKRIDFSHQLVQLRNKEGFEGAYRMMATGRGKFYTDLIRKLTAEIQQEENDLLVQRQKKNAESISAFNWALRTLLTSLVILLVTMFFVIRYNFIKRRKAEKQSKESQEQIQTIFKGAPDAVIAMDSHGNVVRWNPKAEALFGWTEADMIGQPLSDKIIPIRYREAHKKGLLHFLRTGESRVLNKTIEIQALNKNNIEIDIALSISPTIVKGENLFVGFVRDITEQKKVEAQLKKTNELFYSLFEHNPGSIVISRVNDDKIINVNEAFISSFGFSNREEVLGKTTRELNIVAHPEQGEELVKLLKENKVVKDFEIKTYTKQGKVFWMSTSILIIEIEKEPCLFSISIDISNRKKFEEQLQMANKELEAFSYSVSHDLRSPLRAIHGYTTILSEEYVNKLDTEAKGIMSSILNNAKKMSQLIDDLLEFSKMGKKELQIRNVDMTLIANTVIEDLKNSLPSLRAKVTVHPLLTANTDYNLIRQVFFNLISNAIKYADRKPHPEVEINSFYKMGEIVYYVKDNGVGFDMKYADKLFGVFQRLHSSAEFEGTGVGLALVKRIITRQGGRVWAEAEPGKGATFYFSLNKS